MAARFESKTAALAGKEAAQFMVSGTMANLVFVFAHCIARGSEVILGDASHIHVYENGGVATIGGVQPKTVRINPTAPWTSLFSALTNGRLVSIRHRVMASSPARAGRTCPPSTSPCRRCTGIYALKICITSDEMVVITGIYAAKICM